MYLINSNSIVNNDSLRQMRFAELTQIHSDTFEVKIFETNPAFGQFLKIKITDNQFSSDFKYRISGPPIDPKIKRLEQKLTVKSIPKQKGEMIYGTVYFKGVCEIDCDGEIEIHCDFRAELK